MVPVKGLWTARVKGLQLFSTRKETLEGLFTAGESFRPSLSINHVGTKWLSQDVDRFTKIPMR